MKEQEEILNDQTGNKLITESYELVQREDVDIFTIVTTEKGSFIAIGQSRLTDYTSIDICRKWIEEKNWILIFSLVSLIISKQNA